MSFFVVTSGNGDGQGWPPSPAEVKEQAVGPKGGKAITVIVDNEYLCPNGDRASPSQLERWGVVAVKAACAKIKQSRGIR